MPSWNESKAASSKLPVVIFLMYSLFGDSAFHINLLCIQSYYKAFGADGKLTNFEKNCNAAMKAARITIEKNYGAVSTVFRMCNSDEGFKIAKKNPYALEQLLVSHLLVNCYNCMNGDTVSSNNTFGITSRVLEEYLRL